MHKACTENLNRVFWMRQGTVISQSEFTASGRDLAKPNSREHRAFQQTRKSMLFTSLGCSCSRAFDKSNPCRTSEIASRLHLTKTTRARPPPREGALHSPEVGCGANTILQSLFTMIFEQAPNVLTICHLSNQHKLIRFVLRSNRFGHF